MSDPPVRYLIPIIGLKVPQPWTVGRVIFHPGSDAAVLVGDAPDVGSGFGGSVQEILSDASESSIAEVAGGDGVDDIIDAVQGAIDALRLLQFHRALVQPTWFGLEGGMYRSRIQYVMVKENSGVGGRYRGDMPGTGLTAEAYVEWHESRGFQFLSQALADPNASEGARRASIGSTLFARAAGEHRPDLVILGAMATLDAWLGSDDRGPQTRRLARYIAWFGCDIERESRCARDRPACPYILLNPTTRRDNDWLTAARAQGERTPMLSCYEWHQFMEWYRLRSEVAHGKTITVPPEAGSQAVFRISHHLAEPILAWLGDHKDNPSQT